MTNTLRTLAFVALACATIPTMAQPALAASRLTTAATYLGDYQAHCRISYYGQQTNVAVKVTLIGYASRSPEPISRIFKLGPNNRAAQLSLRCDPAGGTQGCQDTRCVFDIQHPREPPLQFVGAACGPDRHVVYPGQGDCVAAK